MNLTSSQTGTLYFAYGSNLSPIQMVGRLQEPPPAKSSTPIAVARLDGWRWIICGRGYANIVPVSMPSRPTTSTDPESRGSGFGIQRKWGKGVSLQDQGSELRSSTAQAFTEESKGGRHEHADDDNTMVYGLLYNLSPPSERTLDLYEGYSSARNPFPTHNPSADTDEVRQKPYLQGGSDYNKLYLPVRVVKWLEPKDLCSVDFDPSGPTLPGSGAGEPNREIGSKQRRQEEEILTALVYVDELRTEEGEVKTEYIARMERAIGQSVGLGIPRAWVERVMRRWIMVEEREVEAAKAMGWGKANLGSKDGYLLEEY